MAFPSIQGSSASLSATHRPTTPPMQESSPVLAQQPKGLASLLESCAVQRILSLADAGGYGNSAVALLFEGRLPDRAEDRAAFVCTMLMMDEPALSLAVLRLGNLDIRIGCLNNVEPLLRAVRLEPAASFPGVVLNLKLIEPGEVIRMLGPLVELISANHSFSTVKIDWYTEQNFGLGELFNGLAAIEGLKLATGGSCCMLPEDVEHVAGLLARNQTLQSLELDNLPPGLACGPSHDATMRLCTELNGQKRLASLRMNYVAEECLEILGDVIGSSQSMRSFSFSVASTVLAPRLVEGIRKNRTLETVNLKLVSFAGAVPTKEPNAPPFPAIFEKDSGSATSLSLDVSDCSAKNIFTLLQETTNDRNGLTAFGSLIANNHTLHALELRLPRSYGIGLPGIAEGLQRNVSLESLRISFIACLPETVPSILCIDESAWQEFMERIANNRTITELVFQTVNGNETDVHESDELTEMLSFNKSLSLYACSGAYIQGAVAGLMRTLDYATDPSAVIAGHLLARGPRVSARALAMVNKASNQDAVAARRRETLDLIADRRPEKRASVEAALRGIAECAFLAADLFYWMEAEPVAYLDATKRLSKIVDVGIMRERLIAQFTKASDLTAQRLAMLEKTFPPDRKHLVSLLDKEVDYASIEPIVLRFFVGYSVLDAGSDSASIKEWCERSQHMPLYRAYLQTLSMDRARYLRKMV